MITGLSISSGKVSLAWVCPLMVARRLPRWPCTACASWPSERQKQRLGVIPRVQPTKIHGGNAMTYGSKSSRRKSVAEALIAAVAKLHHAPLVHKEPECEALAS